MFGVDLSVSIPLDDFSRDEPVSCVSLLWVLVAVLRECSVALAAAELRVGIGVLGAGVVCFPET